MEVLFEAKVFAGGLRMAPAVTEERMGSQAIDWTLPFVVGNDEAEALLGSIVSDDILAKETKEAISAFLVSEERRHPSKGKGKIPFVDASLKCRVADAIKGVFKMPLAASSNLEKMI